tara:strand:- start:39 stop:575 length:537 start_codon:yes stop_codon:yes gene_type:complete
MYSITELNTNPIFKPPTFILEGINRQSYHYINKTDEPDGSYCSIEANRRRKREYHDDDFLAYKYIKKNLHTSKSYYKQPRQIQLLLDFYQQYVTDGDPINGSNPEFKFYWNYREGTETEFIASWNQQPDETTIVCGTTKQEIEQHNKNIKETILENVATIDYFQEILEVEYDNLDFLY